MKEPKPFQQGRKRTFEQIQESPHYKMRAVLKDLRPHFIQVLKTPDFHNCDAADKIREVRQEKCTDNPLLLQSGRALQKCNIQSAGMKVMMNLYQEITAESSPPEKCSTVPNDLSGDAHDRPKPVELQENAKSAENIPLDGGSPTILSDSQAEGTCIVGGSAFGWNYVTFVGHNSVYYGQTKESFRAANPKLDINE